MHPLFLAAGVDGNDPGIHDDHDTHNEIMLFQDHVGHQCHQVQCFLLWAFQLHHHHQQVCPRKHSAVGMTHVLTGRKKHLDKSLKEIIKKDKASQSLQLNLNALRLERTYSLSYIHNSLGPNGNNTREKTSPMKSLRCVNHTHRCTFWYCQGTLKFFCFRRNKMIEKNNAVVLTILQCSYVPWWQRSLCRWGGTSFLWAPVFHPKSPPHTGHRASLQYSTHISTSSQLQDNTATCRCSFLMF